MLYLCLGLSRLSVGAGLGVGAGVVACSGLEAASVASATSAAAASATVVPVVVVVLVALVVGVGDEHLGLQQVGQCHRGGGMICVRRCRGPSGDSGT